MKRTSTCFLTILVLHGILLYTGMVDAAIWAYTRIELYKGDQRVGMEQGPEQTPGDDATTPALYKINNDDEYAALFPDTGASDYIVMYSMAAADNQLVKSQELAQKTGGLSTGSGWSGMLADIVDAENSFIDRIKMLDGRGKSKELVFPVPYPNPYYDKIAVIFLAYSDTDRLDPLLYLPETSRSQPFLEVDYCTSGCWDDLDRYDIRTRFVRHHQWVKYTIDIHALAGRLRDDRRYSPSYFPVDFLVYETKPPGAYFGPRLYLNHIIRFHFTRSGEDIQPVSKPVLSDKQAVVDSEVTTRSPLHVHSSPTIRTTANYRIHNPVQHNGQLHGITETRSELMVYTPEVSAMTENVTGGPVQFREIYMQADARGIFRYNGWPYDKLNIVFTAESNQALDPTRQEMEIDARLLEKDAPSSLQPMVTGVIPGMVQDQKGHQYLTEGLGAAIVEFEPSLVLPGTYNLVFSAAQKDDGWSAKQTVRIIILEPETVMLKKDVP